MDADAGWRPLRRPVQQTSGEPTPFSRLAVTHALAAAGDATIAVALAGSLFFDLSPSAARTRVALSLLLTIAPFAVVAPFLGPAIDRLRGGRRAMVLLSSAGRAVLCALLAGSLDALALFPLAFGALVLGKAHGVAKSSLVPAAVTDHDQLVEANSKLSLVSVFGGLAGSLPAVALLQLFGGEWSLRLGVVLFSLAAMASLRIVEDHRPEGGEDAPTFAAQLLEHHVVLAAATMAVLRFCAGLLAFQLAFSLRRDGAPAWWFGVVLLSSMGGTMAGAVVAPRVRAVLREETMLTGALVSIAVVFVVAARADTRPVAALTAAALGLAAGAAKLAFDALVQRDAPDVAKGRSFAVFESGFQLAWVVGALLPTVVAVPDRIGFFVMSVACAVTALSVLAGGSDPGPGETARAAG